MTETTVERDVKVVMADGAALLIDVYHPVDVDRGPVVLVRVPYGRRMALGAEDLTARGYHVVVQAVRGTDGSDGVQSYLAEYDDGLATAKWIDGQPWCDGNLGVTGASYMGYTAWALAVAAPPNLRVAVIKLAGSDRRSNLYPGGSLALDIGLAWNTFMARMRQSGSTLEGEPRTEALGMGDDPLTRGLAHLPLGEADTIAAGEVMDQYRRILEHHHPDDPYWDAVDFSQLLHNVSVPVLLVDAWHDYNVPRVVDDYVALRRLGNDTRLVVSAGTHTNRSDTAPPHIADLEIAMLDTYLRGATGRLPDRPVAIEVTGADGGWRELEDWPPPGTETRWCLHAGGRLDPSTPEASAPDDYVYDPADPTPAVGGNSLLPQYAGPVDNADLERRADVLVYTSDPLDTDLEVIGPVWAELFATSSARHTDFFVRLCDVGPDGISVNVTDGIVRLRPSSPVRRPDGVLAVTVRLWDVAHRFGAGHRLRVQVSSGAHPRYARNLGTGESPLTATHLVTAQQRIFHDPPHPSGIVLLHSSGRQR